MNGSGGQMGGANTEKEISRADLLSFVLGTSNGWRSKDKSGGSSSEKGS